MILFVIDNYASIVKTVQDYVSLIGASLPSYHFDELHNVASTSFRFAEKSTAEGYVTSLAEVLAKPYAREDVLSAGTLMYGEWDSAAQAAVSEIVKTYMLPENVRVSVMLRDEWDRIRLHGKQLWENGIDNAEWEKEKWYGTQYTVRKTDFSDGAAVGGLHLPPPNEFIPKNFDIDQKEVKEVCTVLNASMLIQALTWTPDTACFFSYQPLKRPLKIRESSLSTLWYKKDDQFWVPKASFSLFIRRCVF